MERVSGLKGTTATQLGYTVDKKNITLTVSSRFADIRV